MRNDRLAAHRPLRDDMRVERDQRPAAILSEARVAVLWVSADTDALASAVP
jgi:hypothetical protein